MKALSLSELRYQSVSAVIQDVFPESWMQKKEFSLYKEKPRPCNALFFICTDTEVTFFPSAGDPLVTRKGDVVAIPQGTRYSVRVTGESGLSLTYTVNYYLSDDGGESLSLSDGIAVLTNRQDPLLEARLKSLCDIMHNTVKPSANDRPNLLRLRGDFLLLLDWIAESAMQGTDVSYPIRKGIDALREEWNRNERIEKYAELCGVSATYFYRCFRRWSGKSPVEYRNALRLSNAESLLRCTDMRIGEISELVGFEDPFYFCRIFRERFGLSPQGYRKRSQENGG